MKWILIIAHFAIAGEPARAVLDPTPWATYEACNSAAQQLKEALAKEEPGTIYCFAVTPAASGHLDIGDSL
jgi:hypothetical protein